MATIGSKIRVRKDVLFKDLGGEAVILDLDAGKYYGLDEVGARMWSVLIQHGRVEPAYRILLEEYDVNEDQLRQDLLGLIDKLASHALLQVDEA